MFGIINRSYIKYFLFEEIFGYTYFSLTDYLTAFHGQNHSDSRIVLTTGGLGSTILVNQMAVGEGEIHPPPPKYSLPFAHKIIANTLVKQMYKGKNYRLLVVKELENLQ